VGPDADAVHDAHDHRALDPGPSIELAQLPVRHENAVLTSKKAPLRSAGAVPAIDGSRS
jgi:hypothetical protein